MGKHFWRWFWSELAVSSSVSRDLAAVALAMMPLAPDHPYGREEG